NTPPVAGALEYGRRNGDGVTLGIMTQYLPAAHDAWEYTLESLNRYFDRVQTLPKEAKIDPLANGPLLALSAQTVPEDVAKLLGAVSQSARPLRPRTRQPRLHLPPPPISAGFAPAPVTPRYQRSL